MSKSIPPILLLLLCLSACEDFFQTAVELELEDYGNRIVVNCIYHPDTSFIVGIERSKGILENSSGESRILPDATIELYGDRVLLETLHRDSLARHEFPFPEYIHIDRPDRHPSYLKLQTPPQINVDYTIKVRSTGMEPSEATNQIPTPVPIKSVYVSDSIVDQIAEESTALEYELTIEFDDDPLIENYYHIGLFAHILYKEPVIDSGQVVYDNLGNPLFTGREELHTISGSFYTFDPSFEQVTNSSLDPSEVDIPDRIYFLGEKAFFSDYLFNGGTKQLKIWIPAWYIDHALDPFRTVTSFIELGTISEDLYKYLYSVERHRPTTDDPFAERSPVHNNVKGGMGIFGGYSIATYKLQ